MRLVLTVLFLTTLAGLAVCLVAALKSKKSISKNVSFLIAAVIPTLIGNLTVLVSTSETLSTAGFYLMYLGSILMLYSSLRFAYAYCDMAPKPGIRKTIDILMIIDSLQYLLNPLTGFTFSTRPVEVEGNFYYLIEHHAGQIIHLVLIFCILFGIMLMFAYKCKNSPRIYAERYAIILGALIVATVVVFIQIRARSDLDHSMFGFGILALLIFYFALYYRPMKLLDKMLSGMASEMPDALFFFDPSGRCVWMNEPGRKLLGDTGNNYEDVKTNLTFLFGDIDFNLTGWSQKITLGVGEETQYTSLEMRTVVDENGKNTGSYLSVRDTTEEQNELRREMHKSTHDDLTDFYTKEYLYEHIEKRLKNDNKTDYMIGYLEIANYKLIKDIFGSSFCDLTVKAIADFIQEGTNPKSIYGRLSDDSFGILIDKEDFMSKPVDEKISNFVVRDNNVEHHILIHYGIYDLTADEEIDVPSFFNSAHLAISRISDSYSTHIVYYDEKIRNEIVHDQTISNELSEAIRTRQIRPFLQPIVDERGLLSGAEALVRWITPTGVNPPGTFIPVFEQNGLINEVDKHMWRCACEILADWKTRGIEQFISVNISPKDFYFMDVARELKNLVEEFDIEPKKLRIEITETVIMTDAEERFKIIEDLRNYGFIVEMDDFGSGYSSLNLLKDMPVDVLKIDMQFLRDSERNLKAGLIIKNIIRMSYDLGIDTLTEGVETAAQFEKLYAMGCKLYQGYYFSKPVPVDEFEKQWFD